MIKLSIGGRVSKEHGSFDFIINRVYFLLDISDVNDEAAPSNVVSSKGQGLTSQKRKASQSDKASRHAI